MEARRKFYKSTLWRDYRRQLINIRAIDGITYCEECNKPVDGGWSTHLHHVIELNDFNVGDADIALNPENIRIIHRRCHDKMHQRFGYNPRKSVILVQVSKDVDLISLKNTLTSSGDLFISHQLIREAVSPLPDDNSVTQTVITLYEHAVNHIKMRAGKWTNAYIVTSKERQLDIDDFVRRVNADEVIDLKGGLF